MALFEIDCIHGHSYYTKARAGQIHDRPIYCDITLVSRGSLFYRIDGEPVQLNSGDVIVLPAGCSRYRAKSTAPAGYTSFNFTLRDSRALSLRGYYKGALTPQVADLIRLYVSSEDPRKEEKRRHILCAILWELVAFTEKKVENENIHIIKRYIREHLSEEICLSDIAQAVHLHPAYCCGLFKKETDTTIIEYINASRVELAKKFLRSADVVISDIPELCGFTNYKYFARVFKKSTGLSPSAYRKKNDLRLLEG